jgi:hypothetical protein
MIKLVPNDPAARMRAAKAAHKAEYRALIDDGGAFLKSVPVSDISKTIAVLVDVGWLDANKSEDRRAQASAVGRALDEFVDDYVRRHPDLVF